MADSKFTVGQTVYTPERATAGDTIPHWSSMSANTMKAPVTRKCDEMKQFIIWDERDGSPFRADGELVSSGLLGLITAHNVYLTAYGVRPDGAPSYDSLAVGERVTDVIFRMSGSKGCYSVYRVK